MTAAPGATNVAVGEPGGDDRRDQTTEVHRLEGDLLGAGIEPRELHEVVDEGPQPGDVGDEQLAGPTALRRQRVEVLAHDRCLGDERRERRPELVRHVGHEPAVLGLGRLEPADRLAEGLGHPVEPLRPGPELVVRGDGHPRGQVAALDPLRGSAGRVDRGEDAARDDPRDDAARRGSARRSRR